MENPHHSFGDHEINVNDGIDKIDLLANAIHNQQNWWTNSRASQKEVHVNANGRYECPREFCGKSYKEASSLQRHIRCVF